MKYSLNRFEGDFAVIEAEDDNGETAVFSTGKENISESAAEGDILIISEGVFTPDREETAKIKKSLSERLRKLTDK
ncbi:MAG: DUF3006 domain-containing protein [Ruminiclostridium sp.]